MIDIWLLCSPYQTKTNQANILFEKLSINFKDKVQIVFTNEIALALEDNNSHVTDLKGKVLPIPKVVFCILVNPTLCFDREIVLLRHLEMLGCKVINSSEAILNCVNKFAHLQILNTHKLPIPQTICSTNCSLSDILKHPFVHNKSVIKAIKGNNGQHAFLNLCINTVKDMAHCLELDLPYMIQEYIEESRGKILKIVVINDEIAHTIIMEQDNNLVKDRNLLNVTYKVITSEFPEAEKIAKKAIKALKMDLGSVDILFKDDDSFIICEVNKDCFSLMFSDNLEKLEKLIKKYIF